MYRNVWSFAFSQLIYESDSQLRAALNDVTELEPKAERINWRVDRKEEASPHDPA